MANFKIKNLPPIRLVDLLKKRKTNLKNFLSSSGIVAYQTLLQKCEKMGVSPPPEEEFKIAVGPAVSSPQEGLIVLDPPSLLKDSTGEKIDVDTPSTLLKETSPFNDEEKEVKKKEKSLKIDESIFITSLQTDNFERSDSNLGEATSVEDDIDSSVTRLSTLKKSK